MPVILFGCLIASSVVGVLVFFLATEEEPAPGGDYVEGIPGTPSSLNPLLASFNDADRDLTALLFSGLTRLDKDGTVRPDLAREWSIGGDGKSYTFQLREDARWHDGEPVRPEDIALTVRLLQDKDLKGNPELAALWRKVKVESGPGRDVRFQLEQPFAPFLTYTSIGVLPDHALGQVAAKDLASVPFNAAPVGSGLFRIGDAGLEQVTLQANPVSYGGPPLLGKMQFRFLPDDHSLAAALATRKVEGGLLRPSIGREAIDGLRSIEDLQLYETPRTSYSLLFLNTRSDLFKERGVRQALAYGIDRQKLVEQAVGGRGIPAEGPIAKDSWAFDPGVWRYPYDPAKARQLLEEQGWKLNNAGLREKNARALKFSILTNDDKVRVAIGADLASQMKGIGVHAEVAHSGVTGLVQNFLLPRKFDAVLYGVDPGYDPDPYPLWHSTQGSGEGLNLSVFAQPEVDQLLEKARTSSNAEERQALYRQFQEAFSQEVPSIPLYHPLYTYAIARTVKGVSLGLLFDTSSRFLNVRSWYKDTMRVFRS